MEALEVYRDVLTIKEKVLGCEHLDVASTQNKYACTHIFTHACDAYMCACSLAVIHKRQGELPTALELYQKNLAVFEKQLGPEHPLVADTKNKCVCIYGLLGLRWHGLLFYFVALVRSIATKAS